MIKLPIKKSEINDIINWLRCFEPPEDDLKESEQMKLRLEKVAERLRKLRDKDIMAMED